MVKGNRQRHRIEDMFGRLKDWRRIATRYDRCPELFLSAITLAAIVIFWLWVQSLLYLRFAILTPSATLAKVADGTVFGV